MQGVKLRGSSLLLPTRHDSLGKSASAQGNWNATLEGREAHDHCSGVASGRRLVRHLQLRSFPAHASSRRRRPTTHARACSPGMSARVNTATSASTGSTCWPSPPSKAMSGPARPKSGWVSSSTSGLTSGSVRPCRPSLRARPADGRPASLRSSASSEASSSCRSPSKSPTTSPSGGPRSRVGSMGRAEALTGPTTPPGQRVQMINPPGLGGRPRPGRHLGPFGRSANGRLRLQMDWRKPLQQAYPVRLDRPRLRLRTKRKPLSEG